MTMLEAFVKERNEALFSLDRKKIEAYMIKYGETEIAQTPDVVFWASVYKAICGIKDAPEAIVSKAKAVVAELRAMKLKEAAKKVEDGIEETLTYCDFPSEHWTRIRTNNVIERLNREIRRRTRVVGTFPDGNSALMLVCARFRHVAGTQWGNKKYMNMKYLEVIEQDLLVG